MGGGPQLTNGPPRANHSHYFSPCLMTLSIVKSRKYYEITMLHNSVQLNTQKEKHCAVNQSQKKGNPYSLHYQKKTPSRNKKIHHALAIALQSTALLNPDQPDFDHDT